jgi:hypothetical protein
MFLKNSITTISTIVIRLHWNLTASFIPGGITEMGKRKTTGQETTTLLIPANAEFKILASTLISNAIATPTHP